MIELLFYLSLFGVFSIAVINSIIVMGKSFQQTNINTDFIQSLHIVERISRDIKNSYSIHALGSGDITLNTRHEITNTPILRRYKFTNGNVELYENEVLIGNINNVHTDIDTLTFTRIDTARGTAVKIFLQVSSNRDPSLARTEDFYTTVVLRGDY